MEEEIATHSSIFPWKFPWTVELDGLQSTQLHRIKYDRATKCKHEESLLRNIIQNEAYSLFASTNTGKT